MINHGGQCRNWRKLTRYAEYEHDEQGGKVEELQDSPILWDSQPTVLEVELPNCVPVQRRSPVMVQEWGSPMIVDFDCFRFVIIREHGTGRSHV